MLASQNNDLLLGQTKIHLSSVDSTNNYAANMLKAGLLNHGTVILADEQTNGRGQRGSVWQSEPGMNLQMSLVLTFENVNSEAQRFINSLVSISMVSLLNNRGIEAKIKWPNDILVNNKKIAGILIENQLSKQNINSSIIGIGLNVNQLDFKDLFATSLKNEIGSFTPISEVLDSLLLQLNLYYEMFAKNNFSELEKNYFKHLWGFQELKKFSDKNGDFSGTITGISDNGLLIIETEEGQREYDIKEIKVKLEE
ncbi:MAG: biotin--[acetyl-CoA-carboxylase] ligase [Bacteroidota bacterium]